MGATERNAPLQFVLDVVHDRLNLPPDRSDGRVERIDGGRLLLKVCLDRLGLLEEGVEMRKLLLVALELRLVEKLNDLVGEAEGCVEELIPRQLKVARARLQKRLCIPAHHVGLAHEVTGLITRIFDKPAARLLVLIFQNGGGDLGRHFGNLLLRYAPVLGQRLLGLERILTELKLGVDGSLSLAGRDLLADGASIFDELLHGTEPLTMNLTIQKPFGGQIRR